MFASGRPSGEELQLLEEEQLARALEVSYDDPEAGLELVAGVDVAYRDNVAYSAAVVLDEELELVETVGAQCVVDFPYVPGFLSYRELKPARMAVDKLAGYDVLMVNGHGLAHSRGFGLASHLGLALGKPTIGVARRLLVGTPVDSAADETKVLYNGRVIGARLRSPSGGHVYVSVGHMISLDTAVGLVSEYTLDGRLPEPLRVAHEAARILMKES
jgi:deoxyribonuclease V